MKIEYGKAGNCIYVFRNLEFIFTSNTLRGSWKKWGQSFIHTSKHFFGHLYVMFLIIDPHWYCPSDGEEASPNPSRVWETSNCII
jgi:hypothetical protein